MWASRGINPLLLSSLLFYLQATFMLGDPVTKPKEYGDIMGYYSRQTCGQMLRTVFTRLRRQAAPSGGKPQSEPNVRRDEVNWCRAGELLCRALRVE